MMATNSKWAALSLVWTQRQLLLLLLLLLQLQLLLPVVRLLPPLHTQEGSVDPDFTQTQSLVRMEPV